MTVVFLTNSTIFRLLLAVVILSPLPLGGQRPWAWCALAIAVGAVLCLWGVLAGLGRARAPVPLSRLWAVMLPFGAVLAWAFLQTMPVVAAFGVHPLWAEAAQALAGTSPGESATAVRAGISLDPELTRTAILRLLSYGGVFWLAVQLGRDRARAHEALVVVGVAGILYAAYGLIAHFAGGERILWLAKWAYIGDLTATFVNRNAYGAYAGLGVLCCVGLFINALRPPRRTTATRRAYDLAETVLVRAMPFLVGAMIIGTALLLSHSRGAFLCTGLGLLALMVAAMVSGMMRPRMGVVLGVVILGAGLSVVGVSGEGTAERLADTLPHAADEARHNLYRLTVEAIGDAPWTGHGFGAFLPSFRMYRDTSLAAPNVWDFAHNVPLETAMDLGLPAAALLYVSLAAVLGPCLGGLIRRRRDHVYPAVALAAAVLIGSHSLVDFSAEMPAVALTLALLLGVGFAQSWSTSEESAHRIVGQEA